MNAWHLPDFHREWVDLGLIRAQDLNVNILQDPAHYRIDIAPAEYKQAITEKYQRHLEWLALAGDSTITRGLEVGVVIYIKRYGIEPRFVKPLLFGGGGTCPRC
jgi:hypothetical protein